MTSSLADLIRQRQDDHSPLHRRHVNPSLARVQAIISFDDACTRGEGAYLWDADEDHCILNRVGAHTRTLSSCCRRSSSATSRWRTSRRPLTS